MTTCIAAVCDWGSAIVLIADKMIGMGYVESELEVTKMREIHKNWWMLFAGDDISPVFDIVDYAKEGIGDGEATIGDVQKAVEIAFARKRMELAVLTHLTPIGWDIERFNDQGSQKLPDFEQLKEKINDFGLSIELLVAGFDGNKGYVFSMFGEGQGKGIPSRLDIPGFQSIGSGSTVANFMLYYREMRVGTPVREAVFYALEAKYTAEQASGVGSSTDLFVARPNKELIQISDEDVVEKSLIPICYSLSPNLLKREHFTTLNNIPELHGFPEVKKEEKKKKPKPQKMPNPMP